MKNFKLLVTVVVCILFLAGCNGEKEKKIECNVNEEIEAGMTAKVVFGFENGKDWDTLELIYSLELEEEQLDGVDLNEICAEFNQTGITCNAVATAPGAVITVTFDVEQVSDETFSQYGFGDFKEYRNATYSDIIAEAKEQSEMTCK